MMWLRRIGSFLLHLVAIGVIVWFIQPIINWYINHLPLLGVDFFNTATLARFFRDNLEFLPRSYFPNWHTGSPVLLNIVFMWYWVVGLVAHIYPLISAIKFTMVGSFFVLLLGVYLGCFRLSKNHLLSATLSILVALSANLYGSLIWGGSLPYFANQLFFPLALWGVASYIETSNRRYYWLAILFTGLAFLGHLVNAGTFVLLGSFAILIFGYYPHGRTIGKRFFDAVIFFVVSYLLAYRLTAGIMNSLLGALSSGNILNPFSFGDKSAATVSVQTSGITVTGNEALVNFERGRFWTIFTDTSALFYMLVIFAIAVVLVAFIIDRHKKSVIQILSWSLLLTFAVGQVFLNARGVSFLSQAWYRAYWHFPIILAFFIAACFGYAHVALEKRWRRAPWIWSAIVASCAIAILGYATITNATDALILLAENRSSPSSAHPEALNLTRTDSEFLALKKVMVPSWLPFDDQNYRLYTSDAEVAVWWSSVYDLPLVRGYLDTIVGSGHAGNAYLLDQAIAGDDLVTNYKYPPEIAANMGLYYVDWYAVKYGEGGHLSKSPNKGVSSYLKPYLDKETETETRGAYLLFETLSGKPEVHPEVPQYLNFYKFKDELVSPVVSISQSPAVMCFCDWAAYESLTKVLSMNNINSQSLVTTFTENALDSYSLDELKHFDALILSAYTYKNQEKAFKRLEEYLQSGGKAIIDTASTVPESQSSNLPEYFPFRASVREGLGTNWSIETADDKIFENIETQEFSAPVYESKEWKFSFPKGTVSSSAQILLKQKNTPLLIRTEVGSGTLIWSGMNLAYHIQHNTNFMESKLYLNILKSLVPISPKVALIPQTTFNSGRDISVSSSTTGKGILVKYANFKGWNAKVNGVSQKIYAAGPHSPGFMYVPLKTSGAVSAQFTFNGTTKGYFIFAMTISIALFLLDMIILNGWLVGRNLTRLGSTLYRLSHTWWHKEEEV